MATHGDPPRRPWIYLIVATGDIHEDIPQAQAAARAGADVIAVIRSTGQSLLDYVPEGATRTGYAGTYATQENFRLMRAALDDVSAELGRYVRLTNYASGLCMPEIAVLAGLERLDMMLNDAMYGILFRDINPRRTFVDQRFSRMVHARAGIIINTGEDNYLTTADAVDEAHTVTVSQLLNEYFAKEAGLEDWQLGLGHAFEIDPDIADSFRLELAHAMLARELFPHAPLKWMPPPRHMTRDVFRGYLLYQAIRFLGSRRAVWLDAAAFGIYHWFSYNAFGNPIAMTYIFVLTGAYGYMWALAFAVTGSIAAPIGLHLGWNVVSYLVFSAGPLGRGILVPASGAERIAAGNWASLVFNVLLPLATPDG